mmetsp:Transcript_32050/g.91413  ORF Transcript_32050/g.91413 Transcript_32050/m.91413 type:complete len:224 (+) Transcript_32050:462-1133(+)
MGPGVNECRADLRRQKLRCGIGHIGGPISQVLGGALRPRHELGGNGGGGERRREALRGCAGEARPGGCRPRPDLRRRRVGGEGRGVHRKALKLRPSRTEVRERIGPLRRSGRGEELLQRPRRRVCRERRRQRLCRRHRLRGDRRRRGEGRAIATLLLLALVHMHHRGPVPGPGLLPQPVPIGGDARSDGCEGDAERPHPLCSRAALAGQGAEGHTEGICAKTA